MFSIFGLTNLQLYLRDLLIFSYTDLIEILLISLAVYYFARWLQYDRQKNLAPMFFATCMAITSANYWGLTNLSNLVLSCWPLILMLFILVHQQTLQKNFIAFKKIIPAKILIPNNWVESLIAACMTSPQKNQKLICILEGIDNLSDFLTSEFMINSVVSKPLLETVLNSQSCDNQKIIWLTQDGNLTAINASWNLNFTHANLTNSTFDNCLLLSQQIDLIYLEVDQKLHQFSLIAQGQLIKNLHTNDIIKVLQQYIRKNQAHSKSEPGVNWHDLKKQSSNTNSADL